MSTEEIALAPTLSQGSLPEERTLVVGEVLASRYRITRFIASGGMGEVYAATDTSLGVEVAVKTLSAGRATDARAIDRFRREIRLARRVTHPHVGRVYDVGFHGERLHRIVFFTMELLPGESLAERIYRSGPLPLVEVAAIGRGCAEALGAAHSSSVIHRDFKSSNVILVGRASPRPVVTDFGLARALDDDDDGRTLSREAALIGTPAYMAPEQVEGGPLGVATDVYAFGVVLFEMLTGERPFVAATPLATAMARLSRLPPSPSTRRRDLSPAWDALVLRCMARRPEDRFASMQEVVDALAAVEGGARADSIPPSLSTTARAWDASATATASLEVERTAPDAPETSLRAPAASAFFRAARQWPKRWRVGAVIGLGLAGVLAAGAYGAPSPSRSSVAPASSARPSVALVVGREVLANPDRKGLARTLTEMLRAEVAAGGAVRVASWDALLPVGRDQESMGSLTGTDYVVEVSATRSSAGRVRTSVRLVDATRRSKATLFEEMVDDVKLGDAAAVLARRVRLSLGAAEPDADALRAAHAVVPSDAEAVRAWVDGLDALQRLDAAAARPRLELAVERAPRFALAHASLARAWVDLGDMEQARLASQRALDASADLARDLALHIRAQHHETIFEWERAADIYRSLHQFFPDDPEHTLDLARVLVAADRSREAAEILAELAREGRGASDPRVPLAQAEAANGVADHKGQLEFARRALELARAAGARPLEARALFALANARVKLEGGPASLADYEEAERIYREADMPAAAARVAGNATYAYVEADDHARGLAAAARAVEFGRAHGDTKLEAIGLGATGMALVKHDPAQARARFEAALTLFRKISNSANIQWVLVWLGRLDEREGHLASARARNEEAASLARGVPGRRQFLATSQANLAAIAVASGDLDAAMRAADMVTPILEDIGHRSQQAKVLLSVADVHLERGAFELAEPTLDDALTRFRDAKSEEGERLVDMRRAQIKRARGDFAAARALLRTCLDRHRDAKDLAGAAWTTLALAEVDADAEASTVRNGKSPISDDTASRARATVSLEEVKAALHTLDEHRVVDGAAWGEAVVARMHLLAGNRREARIHADSALDRAQHLESRVLRLRAVADAAHVLVALGEERRARSIVGPASSEAARLGLVVRERELRKVLK